MERIKIEKCVRTRTETKNKKRVNTSIADTSIWIIYKKISKKLIWKSTDSRVFWGQNACEFVHEVTKNNTNGLYLQVGYMATANPLWKENQSPLLHTEQMASKITEIAQSMKNHNSKAEWKLVSWRSYGKIMGGACPGFTQIFPGPKCCQCSCIQSGRRRRRVTQKIKNPNQWIVNPNPEHLSKTQAIERPTQTIKMQIKPRLKPNKTHSCQWKP